MNKLTAKTGLALLALVFVAAMMIASHLFAGLRVDFTEDKLYTLSDGTKRLLDKLEEPITLKFYFSETSSKAIPALRTYAQQVRELLQEYEALAGGKIELEVVDPEPFSEAEDEADAFGLQPLDAGNGEKIYFGLAGTNSTDGQEVIPLFQVDKADTLEYDISRLVYQLNRQHTPVVGLITGLPVTGGFDMVSRHPTPAWLSVQQMQQLFEVKTLAKDLKQIPDNLDVLLLIHPKKLPENTQKAIDDYVLRGGHLLVFVDPLAEADKPASNMMSGHFPGSQASDLKKLFSAWGIRLRENQVVLDALNGLEVVGNNNTTIRHPGILGLRDEALNGSDVITRGLGMLTLSSVGALETLEHPALTVEPLLLSSDQAMLTDSARMQMVRDPMTLIKDFKASKERYPLAVRLSGIAVSAFAGDGNTTEDAKNATAEKDNGQEDAPKARKGTKPTNIIVVADTDLLTDRLWVQFRNFLGQRIAYPWASNGTFLINAVENLAGSDDLIAIRSRARKVRPFTRVEALRVQAEQRFRDKEKELQARLTSTENQIAQLQKQKRGDDALVLSPEQKRAIESFEKERLRIRKELRQVQHQLNEDIERLGSQLKLLTIVVAPLLLTFLLAVLMGRLRRRRHAVMLERMEALR